MNSNNEIANILGPEILDGIREMRPDNTGTVWVPEQIRSIISQRHAEILEHENGDPQFEITSGVLVNTITITGIPARERWGLYPINLEWH